MDIEQMALMIPILGVVLGVSVAIVAIITSHREKQKRAELRHRERIAAIEKGMEIPPDPEPDVEVRKGGSLKSGLAGLFLGIVLYFALRAGRRRRRRAVRADSRLLRRRQPDQLFRGIAPQRERRREVAGGSQPPMAMRASVPPPARGSSTSVPASPKQSRRRSATFARP